METRLTKLLNMSTPIMVAGMAPTTGPELAAAASNFGGFGTMGCSSLSPEGLRSTIRECKALLNPGRPMGVDLLLPKTGEGAKKTNKSYSADTLEAIVMVMEEDLEGGDLFVCAVGLPPVRRCPLPAAAAATRCGQAAPLTRLHVGCSLSAYSK